MSVPSFLRPLVAFFLCTLVVSAQNEPSAQAFLGSSFAIAGEEVPLVITLEKMRIIGWPKPPRVTPLTLKQNQRQNININGRIAESYTYYVSCVRPGIYNIPSFTFNSSTSVVKTEPLTLRVLPRERLAAQTLEGNGGSLTYYSGVFLTKTKPFVGESIAAEAKIYIPQTNSIELANPGYAEFEKTNIAAWRFDCERRIPGRVRLQGKTYLTYAYTSYLNALREGKLTLGPGKTINASLQRRMSRGGFFMSRSVSAELKFPALEFEARPLPANAPDNFQGAVGNFTLNTKALNTEIKAGDTITVDAQITGVGNLEQFPGPQLDASEEDWKQFEMTAKTQGIERQLNSGSAEFTQVIRPNKLFTKIPPYRFSFFDPVLEEYRTISSPAQAIKMSGDFRVATTPSGTLPFLTPSARTIKTLTPSQGSSNWLWHLIPASLVIAFFALKVRKKQQAKTASSIPEQEFHRELKALYKEENDRGTFYRKAANFATRWKAGADHQDIFDQRDEISFRPDAAEEDLPETEKNRIVNLLKKLAPLLLLSLLFLTSQPALALSQDPTQAKEELLQKLASEPAPENFYNLSLVEEALGQRGEAALWGYRYEAQGLDADSLLERLPGIKRSPENASTWIAALSKNTYLQLALAGVWALALIFCASIVRSEKVRKTLRTSLAVLAFILLAVGIAGWFLRPDDISFEPLADLSVATTAAPLLSQPYDGSLQLRENLEGSLCKIQAIRSGFAKIELPGGLEGWISTEALEPIANR